MGTGLRHLRNALRSLASADLKVNPTDYLHDEDDGTYDQSQFPPGTLFDRDGPWGSR